MKRVISILMCQAALGLSTLAAVPLHWTVETSRATPAQFEAYQGETLALEAALQSYGNPLEASGIASLYWQPNGMGSTYWETSAAVNLNRLSLPSSLRRWTLAPAPTTASSAFQERSTTRPSSCASVRL